MPKKHSKYNIQKYLCRSQRLSDLADTKASYLGMGFADYIKFLIAKDVEPISGGVYMATKEEEQAINDGMSDIEKGRYVDVDNEEDLNKVLGTDYLHKEVRTKDHRKLHKET